MKWKVMLACHIGTSVLCCGCTLVPYLLPPFYFRDCPASSLSPWLVLLFWFQRLFLVILCAVSVGRNVRNCLCFQPRPYEGAAMRMMRDYMCCIAHVEQCGCVLNRKCLVLLFLVMVPGLLMVLFRFESVYCQDEISILALYGGCYLYILCVITLQNVALYRFKHLHRSGRLYLHAQLLVEKN